MKQATRQARAHMMPRHMVEEATPMEVRVIERWIEDPVRAQQAREYLDSLIGYLAMRKIVRQPQRRPDTTRDQK